MYIISTNNVYYLLYFSGAGTEQPVNAVASKNQVFCTSLQIGLVFSIIRAIAVDAYN